jgi:hypothetical protein
MPMNRFFTRIFLYLVAMFLLSVTPSFSQSAANGTIAGSITDISGAALAGAVVVITNTDTGAVHTLTTNSDGSFNLAFLQSGHYEVLASAPGFTRIDHRNLQLTVGQVLTVNSMLPAASVTTDVIVTTAETLIAPQKVEASQTITQNYVANLPVNGRRWDNFVLLTPNVAPDSNSGLISYRGVSGLYNSNLVDGVSNQQALFAEARGRATGSPYVYSPDSIKEFQSSVSGYSAEFGGAAGGQVNAISKSGANAMHGDLFYYLRYPSLNALDPYSKWQALHAGGLPALLTQTVHQQQQFGGSVGGPLIKDKLFYFFTYDGFRKAAEALYSTTTPSSTLASYATSPLSCPSPLTATQCQNAVNFLVSQQGAFGRNITQDIFFPKLDYQLDEKDHISTSFLWQDYKQPNAYASAVSFNNSGVQTNGTLNFHERFYIASWERVLNARTANSLKFQWARDLETAGANGPGPNVSITNVAGYGEATGVPRAAEPDEHRWQIVDVVSQTRAHHTLKAGADLNFIHMIMINLFSGDGAYSYSASSSGTLYTAFGNWVQDVYGVNGGTPGPPSRRSCSPRSESPRLPPC